VRTSSLFFTVHGQFKNGKFYKCAANFFNFDCLVVTVSAHTKISVEVGGSFFKSQIKADEYQVFYFVFHCPPFWATRKLKFYV